MGKLGADQYCAVVWARRKCVVAGLISLTCLSTDDWIMNGEGSWGGRLGAGHNGASN